MLVQSPYMPFKVGRLHKSMLCHHHRLSPSVCHGRQHCFGSSSHVVDGRWPHRAVIVHPSGLLQQTEPPFLLPDSQMGALISRTTTTGNVEGRMPRNLIHTVSLSQPGEPGGARRNTQVLMARDHILKDVCSGD